MMAIQVVDYSNTLLIIRPVGEDAHQALQFDPIRLEYPSFDHSNTLSGVLRRNLTRLVEYAPGSIPLSREGILYVPPPRDIQFHLRFQPLPKDCQIGFVFGTSRHCDIMLVEHTQPGKRYRISRKHFAIGFNRKSQYPILINISQYGTGIEAPYVNNGYRKLKDKDTHELFQSHDAVLYVGSLKFVVSFPNHEQCWKLFERNWKRFWGKYTTPPTGGLHGKIQSDTEFCVGRNGRKAEKSYVLNTDIGNGQFGRVYKAALSSTAEVFAAKVFFSRDGQIVNRECELALKLKHENIVKALDVIDDNEGFALVMEYFPLGNLRILFEGRKGLNTARDLDEQILGALCYLHDSKIIHRDLKLENILVKSNDPLIIKLCDFGAATAKSNPQAFCGTKCYAAPEIYSGRYDCRVNLWSLGVITCEYIHGLPNRDETAPTFMNWCESIRGRVDGSKAGACKSFLQRMLELQPENRPLADDCLLDPWFSKIRKRPNPEVSSGLRETEWTKRPRFGGIKIS